MKLKKGDNVIVIAGKEKGKKGTIAQVLPLRNAVVIEGLNAVKKTKRSRVRGEKSQVIEVSMPINASNVMIADPKTGKPTRIGAKVDGAKKTRVAKKSGQTI